MNIDRDKCEEPAVILLVVSLALLMSAVMAAGFSVQRARHNAGWVDVFWTFGVGLTGIAAALWPIGEPPGARQWLVAALVAAWSLRLGLHIAQRVATAPEDARYGEFRRQWGADFSKNLFWFMQRQAFGSLPLPLAILVAARHPAPDLRLVDYVGVAILVVAIAGEAIADAQLRRFKSDPANHGRICDAGLWSLSRHPNYVFQWFGWLAYPVIAVDLSFSYPWGWLALAAPALMYWVLVHLTGIPPLEAHLRRTRGDAFDAYRARTRAFWPWPKRAGG